MATDIKCDVFTPPSITCTPVDKSTASSAEVAPATPRTADAVQSTAGLDGNTATPATPAATIAAPVGDASQGVEAHSNTTAAEDGSGGEPTKTPVSSQLSGLGPRLEQGVCPCAASYF